MLDEIPHIPYGKIPRQWFGSHAIELLDATRWFVERGHVQAYRQWMDELYQANPGELIPMQWAPQYIGVSRPAIRKRAQAGNLTVFSFVLVERVKTLLGRVDDRESRTSFDFLIKGECEAWREALFEQREEEWTAFAAERKHRASRV